MLTVLYIFLMFGAGWFLILVNPSIGAVFGFAVVAGLLIRIVFLLKGIEKEITNKTTWKEYKEKRRMKNFY